MRSALASIDGDLPLAHCAHAGRCRGTESTRGDRALAGIVDFFMTAGPGLLALASLLRSLVWNVDTVNPPALLGSAAVVALAATAACLLPALRAARVDPIVALRTD